MERKRICTGRETSDELGSQGEYLVEIERSVEGFGEGRLLECSANVGGVTRFDGEDGAGDGEVCIFYDRGGSTKVGTDTDAFEDRGESDK